jgi:hypothetical protein
VGFRSQSYKSSKSAELALYVRRYVGRTGLPDGVFSNQKSQSGQLLEGLTMENVGIFYGHMEYFTAMCYIFWLFGNLVVIYYIFTRFGTVCQEISGNPEVERFCQVGHRLSGNTANNFITLLNIIT